MFKRFSLTTSMLIMTVLVGLVIWACYDAYQYRALNTVLKENLTQRFNAQARVHRLRFDSYVKSFYPSVKLYARNERLHDYLQTVDWSEPPVEIIKHSQIPAWLPELSSMRRFVLPRYAMLIDERGQTREIYNYRDSVPSDELLNISPLTREISKGQSYLAMFNERPYLITSEDVATVVNGENLRASLLIASPVDEKFLQDSQGASLHEGVIALLRNGEDRILVSDNSELVAPGTPLSELKKSYLFTREGFFDSGSSDIIVRFCSLISTEEVYNQTAEILNRDRQIRAVTAISSIFAFGLVMYWITSRIRKLSRKVVSFSEKMDMQQPELRHKDELLELENRFEMLADAVQRETRLLEHQTLHDLLTDLPNRKFLHRRLKHVVDSCEIEGCSFVLMVCDLNNFKDVNDTLGHHVGDQVLQHASVRFQSVLRNDDTVARMGGDEFCIVLSRTSYKAAETIANKIIEAFNAPFAIEGNIIKVGISIGIVEYPEHGRDVDSLMKHADAAMYEAKNRRSGFMIYDALLINSERAAR
jgi:diguanylate cyclase (GGDEF)-like protein